jgi:hypothetical protein
MSVDCDQVCVEPRGSGAAGQFGFEICAIPFTNVTPGDVQHVVHPPTPIGPLLTGVIGAAAIGVGPIHYRIEIVDTVHGGSAFRNE